MNLFNFIVWLSVGAFIGWFASRMVDAEQRHIHKTVTTIELNKKS